MEGPNKQKEGWAAGGTQGVELGVMHNPDYFNRYYMGLPVSPVPCPRCKEALIEKPETQNIKRYFVCPKCKWKSA